MLKSLFGFGSKKEESKKKKKQNSEPMEPVKKRKRSSGVDKEVSLDISEESAKDLYPEVLEHKLFIASSKIAFQPIVDEINQNWAGMTAYGTSDLRSSHMEYTKNNIDCSSVIVICNDEDDVENTFDLVRQASITASSSPNVLKVLVYLFNDLDGLRYDELRDRASIKVNKQKKNLSELTSKDIITLVNHVVKNQPANIRDSVKRTVGGSSSITRQRATLENPFSKDTIEDIKKKMSQFKEELTPENISENLAKRFQGITTVDQVRDAMNSLDSYKLIKEYSNIISNEIATHKGDMPAEQLHALAISKLEATSLEQDLIEQVFRTISQATQAEYEKSEQAFKNQVTSYNQVDFEKMMEETNDKLAVRNKLREEVIDQMDRFKNVTQQISISIQAESALYLDIQNDLKMLTDGSDDIDDELEEIIEHSLQIYDKKRNDLQILRDENHAKLIKTLEFGAKTIDSARNLINMDDIIIQDLLDKTQEISRANITKVVKVAHQGGHIMKGLIVDDPDSIRLLMPAMITDNTLVITDRMELFADEKRRYTLEEYLNTQTFDSKPNQIWIDSTQNDFESIQSIKDMIKKVLSNWYNYSKILFITSLGTSKQITSVLMDSAVSVSLIFENRRDRVLRMNSVYQEMINKDNITDVYCIINETEKSDQSINIDEIKILLGARKNTSMATISFEEALSDSTEFARLKTLISRV